jgi:peroxiredoxin
MSRFFAYRADPLVRALPVILLAMVGCGNGGNENNDRGQGAKPTHDQGAAAPAAAGVGLRPGQQPPPFTAVDLDGAPHTLAAYKDNIVLLHFWATWCPYCRKEIPKLKQIVEEQGSHGVKVLAISVDEDVEALREFVRQQQLTYPVISEAANKQSLAAMYEVSGIPTTYVIDRVGRLVGRFQGQGDLRDAVSQLLAYERRQPQASP